MTTSATPAVTGAGQIQSRGTAIVRTDGQETTADPSDGVSGSVSPGLQTFLAKSPAYWTEPEGAEDYPPKPAASHAEARGPETPATRVHDNGNGTLTVIEEPVSAGLATFLAKPPDYWTNPEYS